MHGKVTPYKWKILSRLHSKVGISFSQLTSKTPSMKRTATSAGTPALAANGVSNVNIAVTPIPRPNIFIHSHQKIVWKKKIKSRNKSPGCLNLKHHDHSFCVCSKVFEKKRVSRPRMNGASGDRLCIHQFMMKLNKWFLLSSYLLRQMGMCICIRFPADKYRMSAHA